MLSNALGVKKMEKIDYKLPGTRWRKLLFRKLDYEIKGLEPLFSYVSVYGRAKKIWITAGELFPPFYNNKDFLLNLTISAENYNADIKVIFGPALYVQSAEFLKFALKHENVKLIVRKERERSHFKLIEDINGSKFAFIDEPHDLLVDKRKSILLTGDDIDIISVLEEEFKEKLKIFSPVEKDRIVDIFTDSQKKDESKNFYSGFIYRTDNKVDLADKDRIEELKRKLYN